MSYKQHACKESFSGISLSPEAPSSRTARWGGGHRRPAANAAEPTSQRMASTGWRVGGFPRSLTTGLLFSSPLLSSLLLPAGPCDSALGAGLASSQCVCPWRTQSPALMQRVIQMFRCSDPRNSHFPTFRSFISIEFPIFWTRRKCRTPKGLVLRSSWEAGCDLQHLGLNIN